MNSLFPLPSLHPTPSLGVAPPPPSPRSTSPVWSLLPSKFSFSPHPENILVLTAPVLLGCMSFSWQFSPIPSLFSSLLPPGWLPDSCLWALLYPFLEADPVSTSNSPSWRTCLSPNLLCLPTYLAPIQFLSPPCVIQGASCSMFPWEDWKDRFPARPSYLQTWHGPEQPGTGTAGPAPTPTALCGDALGEDGTAGELHCEALVSPHRAQTGFSVGFFMAGFEGTPLTKWPFSFSGSKIPDRRNERRNVYNLTRGMNLRCLNFSTVVSLALLKVTGGRILWWELLTSFNRSYTTSPAF